MPSKVWTFQQHTHYIHTIINILLSFAFDVKMVIFSPFNFSQHNFSDSNDFLSVILNKNLRNSKQFLMFKGMKCSRNYNKTIKLHKFMFQKVQWNWSNLSHFCIIRQFYKLTEVLHFIKMLLTFDVVRVLMFGLKFHLLGFH